MLRSSQKLILYDTRMITILGQCSNIFHIEIVGVLKTFQCSLYDIFYIKSKQPASINKKGMLEFTFFKIYVCIEKQKKVLNIITAENKYLQAFYRKISKCKEKWHAPQHGWNENYKFSLFLGQRTREFLIFGYIYFSFRKDDKPCPTTNLIQTVSNSQCGGFLSFKEKWDMRKHKKKKSMGEIPADSKRKIPQLLKENGGGNTFTLPSRSSRAQDVFLWWLLKSYCSTWKIDKINAIVLPHSACFSKFMTELQHQCFQNNFSTCINSPFNSAQQVLQCDPLMESCVYFHQIYYDNNLAYLL